MKDKLYEVGIQVKEIWVFEVTKSKKEALRKVKNNEGDSDLEQMYSIAGTKHFVREINKKERQKWVNQGMEKKLKGRQASG